jgi:formate hydrogenlyase subunit 6/NADH:ubiquinone oxidoreductase subunit I
MDALSLRESPRATNKEGKVASLQPEQCIGCGVCVYKCPTKSLILERRGEIYHPPKDVRVWMERYLDDQKAASNQSK